MIPIRLLHNFSSTPIAQAIRTTKSLGGAIWIPGLDDRQNSDGTGAAVVGAGLGMLRDDAGLYPLTQATAANKPLLQKISGRNVYTANFDGINDVMTSAAGWTLSDGLAISWCGAMNSTTTARLFRLRNSANNSALHIASFGELVSVVLSVDGVSGSAPQVSRTVGEVTVWSVALTATSCIVRKNGLTVQTAKHGLTLNNASLYASLGGDFGTSFANNNTYAAAVTMGATDAQLLQIEKGMASLAGITI